MACGEGGGGGVKAKHAELIQYIGDGFPRGSYDK
jgi:hypothetical protein